MTWSGRGSKQPESYDADGQEDFTAMADWAAPNLRKCWLVSGPACPAN